MHCKDFRTCKNSGTNVMARRGCYRPRTAIWWRPFDATSRKLWRSWLTFTDKVIERLVHRSISQSIRRLLPMSIWDKEAVKAFSKAGWRTMGQVGSHLVMTKPEQRANLPFLSTRRCPRALIRAAGLWSVGSLRRYGLRRVRDTIDNAVSPLLGSFRLRHGQFFAWADDFRGYFVLREISRVQSNQEGCISGLGASAERIIVWIR